MGPDNLRQGVVGTGVGDSNKGRHSFLEGTFGYKKAYEGKVQENQIEG